MKEKYEIEIHDITTNSISVYVEESCSFIDALKAAKRLERIYNNNWNRKTEIIRIEKMFNKKTNNEMKTREEKWKKLIREITIAVLSAILTWLGVSCTNMLNLQKNVSNSSMSSDNKTDGKVSADSTSIKLFNKN